MWPQRGIRTASAHLIKIVPKRANVREPVPSSLIHFRKLDDDYMVADPVPDVRDWPVRLLEGRIVGVTEDLVIDTSTMTARYIEVKVRRDLLESNENRWMLVPVESIRIDAKSAQVLVDHLPASALADATRHRGRLPSADEQRIIVSYFEAKPARRYTVVKPRRLDLPAKKKTS
jgi:hypothetical protein